MSSATHNRASLLAGLRTGGVRSASGPAIVPHTAAPGGSFNVPNFSSFTSHSAYDDEDDQLVDMVNHNLHFNPARRTVQPPATASAVDGIGNRFQQQQQAIILQHMAAQRAAMNTLPAAQMAGLQVDPQLQMQMMQLEILKLQALQAQQAQQYQADLFAQAQRQQQQQQQQRQLRRASAFAEPATAGPATTSFDIQPRVLQTDSFGYDDTAMPMTAAIGGKFGSRLGQSGLNPNANVFTLRNDSIDDFEPPKSASAVGGRTTVISGGAALGSTNNVAPSKSDSALSWRRSSVGNVAPLRSSPLTKTPATMPDGLGVLKSRPQPLLFNGTLQNNLGVAIEVNEPAEDGDDSDSSFASDSGRMACQRSLPDRDSSPTTPPSAGSTDSMSTREEASKKLYEGLGIGRPVLSQAPPISLKQLSQPIRQPRGPPASVDELGDRNFATRIPRVVVAMA